MVISNYFCGLNLCELGRFEYLETLFSLQCIVISFVNHRERQWMAIDGDFLFERIDITFVKHLSFQLRMWQHITAT